MKPTAAIKRTKTTKHKSDSRVVLAEITRLRDAVAMGRLSDRAALSKFDGESRILLWRVNDMLDAIAKPFEVTAKYIDKMSKCVIPPAITESYNGEFNLVKNNLNELIRMITALRNALESEIDERVSKMVHFPITKKRFAGIREKVAKTFGRVSFLTHLS